MLKKINSSGGNYRNKPNFSVLIPFIQPQSFKGEGIGKRWEWAQVNLKGTK